MKEFTQFENPWSAETSEWFNEEEDKWFDGGFYYKWNNSDEGVEMNTSKIVNGHLFEDDGFYLGSWGKKSNDCYTSKKGAWRKKTNEIGKTQLEYNQNDILQLIDLDGSPLQLDVLLKLASIVFDEAGATTEFYSDTILAVACANRNFLRMRNTYYTLISYRNLANKEKIKNYAYGENKWIKKADNENLKYVFTIGAILYILTNKPDITNGAVKWDGADLAWKGFAHSKPKNEGINFQEEHFNKFKEFYTAQRLKKYTKLDKTFNPDFNAGKYKAIQSNKDRILHISTGFVGNTIFWKPNYFAEENDVQYEIINGKKIKKSDKYNFKYYFYS